MISNSDTARLLREQQSVCKELLRIVEKENSLLRTPQPEARLQLDGTRKILLAQLGDSLDKIRQRRVALHNLPPAERQEDPEIPELLRDNQNLIMKILVLDRENEQTLLRQGLVPARHVPSANRQRPHFVANMYQRNAAV